MDDINSTINLIDGYLQIKFSPLSLLNIFYALGAIIGFLLFFNRNKIFEKQILQKDEQYIKDSQFKNFLDATKMLTEKDSTIEAKISAMHLLFYLAKQYPDMHLSKTIELLNRFSISLFFPEIQTNSKREVIEWKESGNEKEQLSSYSLHLVKKLFVYAIEEKIKIDEFNGIILFDLDIELDIKDKLKMSDLLNRFSKVIFLHCNFSSKTNQDICIDFSTNFENNVEYLSINNRFNITLSTFSHCNLANCNFSNSNLWGTQFSNCNLKNTKFDRAECEGVQFIKSDITTKQINNMLFINKDHFKKIRKSIEFGIIYPESKNDCFQDWDEYSKFKNG